MIEILSYFIIYNLKVDFFKCIILVDITFRITSSYVPIYIGFLSEMIVNYIFLDYMVLDSEWNDECIDFTMMCVFLFLFFF